MWRFFSASMVEVFKLNIYILTRNNYLSFGLSVLIREKWKCKCSVLNQSESNGFFSYYEPDAEDVFVISMEMFADNFNHLLNIRDLSIPVVIINDSRNSPLGSVFGVCSIPYYFDTEELLSCIKKYKPFNALQPNSKPRLTDRERIVLFNFTKGKNVRSISDSMGISEKTVYSHLAIVMRKIGLKKRVNIGLLPSVYINYLCAGNQSRVVY
jgi:DNA-binding CsgD family transcriptional regulator